MSVSKAWMKVYPDEAVCASMREVQDRLDRLPSTEIPSKWWHRRPFFWFVRAKWWCESAYYTLKENSLI